MKYVQRASTSSQLMPNTKCHLQSGGTHQHHELSGPFQDFSIENQPFSFLKVWMVHVTPSFIACDSPSSIPVAGHPLSCHLFLQLEKIGR